jgi:DNA-binding PadR family transcriptional regulator
MFRYLVLGLLRSGGALHGYALMKVYRERSGVQISTGNFYRELQRLAMEGLVRTAANPDGADPRRAPYEITDAGIMAFDSWLSRNQAAIGQYDDELSARALFISEADAALVRQVLERWQEELWLRSKMFERLRETVLTQPAAAGSARSQGAAARGGRRIRAFAGSAGGPPAEG